MKAMADRTRERLTNLRNHLLRLHKSLLDSERAAYERDVARITSTGQYLQLVLGDALHIPHQPPVRSEKITITVTQ